MGAGPEEIREIGDGGLVGDVEAIAEVVPEREAEPGCGAHEAEESVAAVAAAGHLGAAADLAPGDVQADVALGAIGVERDLRAVEHGQQFRLVGVQACKQAVEGGKTGASSEDAIEADAQLASSPRTGIGAVGLEVGVKPPDQIADMRLRDPMPVGEGIEPVHQPFGVHPAQGVAADHELAGIVADDNGVVEEPMGPDGAPERTFGGDPDRVGMDLECADAEPVQMHLPGSMIGELFRRGVGESADHRAGERASAHIGERRVVDDIVGVAGAQQVEEVQPALALPRAEPGEIVIADMGAESVPSGMPRAGVVHRHPGRCRKSRPQDVAVLRKETVLSLDQQPHHLPLGDRHPKGPQLCRQPLHRHLPLVMQHQHEAAQFRAEMAHHPRRQRREDRSPLRCHPPLPPVADRPRLQNQILNQKALIPLEPRARRCIRRDDPLLDADPGREFAPTFAEPPLRRGPALHPARPARRLDVGRALQPLQTRHLLTQRRNLTLLFRVLRQQLNHQMLQLTRRQIIKVRRLAHTKLESVPTVTAQAKNHSPPGLLPRLRSKVLSV